MSTKSANLKFQWSVEWRQIWLHRELNRVCVCGEDNFVFSLYLLCAVADLFRLFFVGE